MTGWPWEAAPWTGGPVSSRATCVLAPNPGPMTLEGTNTWVLSEPGARRAVVIDPGPDDPRHLATVLEVVRARGCEVEVVLLTHGHPDHAAGASRFADLAAAPVRALDPQPRRGDEGLVDGDVVDVQGLEIRVVATPGHTADSLTFLLSADSALLTGDTVLGRGTTVVMHPDGRLGDYLDSLNRLRRLVDAAEASRVFPGHGPIVDDAGAVLDAYAAHRQQRLAEVAAAVEAGATTAHEVVERVYADVDRALWPAAELSVAAQLEYLRDR